MKDKSYASFFEISGWVRDSRLTKGSAQALLYTLVTRCDPKKDYSCFPSYETLSYDTGLDIKTVKSAADRLIEDDLVSKVARFNGSLVWYINVAKLKAGAEKTRALLAAKKAEATVCPFAPPVLKSGEQPQVASDNDQEVVDEIASGRAQKDSKVSKKKANDDQAKSVADVIRSSFSEHETLKHKDAVNIITSCAKTCIALAGSTATCIDVLNFIFSDEKENAKIRRSFKLGGYIENHFEDWLAKYDQAHVDTEDERDETAVPITADTNFYADELSPTDNIEYVDLESYEQSTDTMRTITIHETAYELSKKIYIRLKYKRVDVEVLHRGAARLFPLLKEDGYDDVDKVIEWTFTDPFWVNVVVKGWDGVSCPVHGFAGRYEKIRPHAQAAFLSAKNEKRSGHGGHHDPRLDDPNSPRAKLLAALSGSPDLSL
jgi:hypothetical protein